MTEFTLYLIQRPDSTYREILQSALASSGISVVMGSETGLPPGGLSSLRAMVVLDTARMTLKQRQKVAKSLAGCETGVLLVAPEAEHFFEPDINRLGLVGAAGGAGKGRPHPGGAGCGQGKPDSPGRPEDRARQGPAQTGGSPDNRTGGGQAHGRPGP